MVDLRVSVRQLLKKQRTSSSSEVPTSPTESKITVQTDGSSAAAKRQQRFRNNIKKNPKSWRLYQESGRERARKSKAKRTPEKREADRVATCFRTAKCTETMIALGLQINNPKKDTPRQTVLNKRQKDAERQQKYRAKMSHQKKAAIALKRKKKREKEKAASLNLAEPSTSPVSSIKPESTGYKTVSTMRKAIKKTKDTMPDSPLKFAEVVDGLIKTKSPRKKAALCRKGLFSQSEQLASSADMQVDMVKEFERLKQSRNSKSSVQRAAIGRLVAKASKRGTPKRKLCSKYGMSWKFLVRCMDADEDEVEPERKQNSNKISPGDQREVENFYNRGDISRDNPLQSSVSARTGEPSRVMEKTLSEAYAQYTSEMLIHRRKKISFSKFAKLKPKRTKTSKHNKIRSCVCEYCANMELKVEAINLFLQAAGRHDLSLGSKLTTLGYTLCEKTGTGFHSKACVDRECELCGIKLIRPHVQPVLETSADTIVTWKRWTITKGEYRQRDGQLATTSKRMLTTCQGPFDQLVCELEEELKPFARHITNAEWQHQQFSHLKENLPDKWVLFVMDFAENYSCFYQDEAQSAHWNQNQVTIHPVVAYYVCPDDKEIMRESFICVSSDLKHDANAVQHFQLTVIRELLGRGLVIEKVIHFSDGCSSQYKCKTSFVDTSYSEEDVGIPQEKHFFGSRHGKGPCDAEIGVIKRISSLAVKRRQVSIATAEELYDFGRQKLQRPLQTNLHCHSKRSFKFFGGGSIPRGRPRTETTKTLQGTRSLHCVRGHTPHIVSSRVNSCFCEPCITSEGVCMNEEFVGPWQIVSLKVLRQRRARGKSSFKIHVYNMIMDNQIFHLN
ncbi:uncharacterized protein [Littorina saxatilis]|uniref:uncharacterized protein n=1 Tax=Littorina saxatilis TaxID=31220 RepID=UPI0038B440A6